MAFRHNSETADKEPSPPPFWGEVDKTKLPRAAFADQGEAGKKSTWSYPHHWVQNGGGEGDNGVYTTGTMYLHRGGLNAAWSAANGGRSGDEASAAVKAHLQAHRRTLGLDKKKPKAQAPASRLTMVAQGGRAEVTMYGVIGQDDLTAKDFHGQLEALGNVSAIDLHVHSEGGSILDGIAMYNLLRDHPAQVTAHIDGMALSMASVVCMGGNEIEMAARSLIMIHNPLNLTIGDADAMRHSANLLDKLKDEIVAAYAERSGQDPDAVAELMDAETWMTAEEALDAGFCDRISGIWPWRPSSTPQNFKTCPKNCSNH